MLVIASPLIALMWLVGRNTAQRFGQCGGTFDLMPGEQITFRSPDYPVVNSVGVSCRWFVNTNSEIDFICYDALPVNRVCGWQTYAIHVELSKGYRYEYCRQVTVEAIKYQNQLAITMTTYGQRERNSFWCTAKVIQRESCKCGWKNPSKIVGGTDTGVNEFTMMAGLVDVTYRTIFCGATIINKKQVLTAAHCVYNKAKREFDVIVGEHDTVSANDTDATKLLRVDSILIHPDYSRDFNDYDLALVTIVREIAFNLEVGPVCLPFAQAENGFNGEDVTVLGWGATEFGGGPHRILQKATLRVITNFQCGRTYEGLLNRQLCTIDQRQQQINRDTCQYDSGGPVLWQIPKTQTIVQIGIITKGVACGINSPAVNVRVGEFVRWIVENTFPGIKYCIVN